MTWGLQQRDFPVLTPEQMNPFNQALAQGLNTYQNITKSAYLPQTLQSEILSKSAYGAYLPQQIKASILQNPLAVASLYQSGELGNFLKEFNNMPANPIEALNRFYNDQNQNRGSGALQKLANMVGLGNDQASLNSQSNPIPQKQNNAPGFLQGEYGAVNQATEQQIDNQIDKGQKALEAKTQNETPAPQTTNQTNPPVSGGDMVKSAVAKILPYSEFAQNIEADRKAKLKTAETTADLQVKNLNKMQQESNKSVKNAFQLDNNVSKFDAAYKKATIKGPMLNFPGMGFIAKTDPETYKAINAANNLAVAMASELFGTRQSDYRERLAQTLKVSPDMPEKTETGIVAGIKAESARLKERSNFDRFMIDELGIKNANVIDNVWFNYNHDRPFFDIDKSEPINKNLNSYRNYVTEKYGKQKTSQSNDQSSNQNTSYKLPPGKPGQLRRWNHKTQQLELVEG